MNKKITTSAANLAFKADLIRVQSWLETKVGNWWGYKNKTITDRLVQQAINSVLSVYATNVYKASINGAETPPDQSSANIAGNVCSVSLDSGAITVSIKQWAKAQALFLAHWCACLASICLPTMAAPGKSQKATLVYGIGDSIVLRGGDTKAFAEYIKGIGFDPISETSDVWFESAKEGSDKLISGWKFARWPLLSVTRFAQLGVINRTRLALALVYDGLLYGALTLKYPFLVLLNRDIPYCTLARYLDTNGDICSVVLTCSNFRSQPLWVGGMTQAATHMIWYSQNWLPIARIADKSFADNPYLPWIRLKTHWVWTKAFGRYLERITPCEKAIAIGPIVWQSLKVSKPPVDRYVITVFDVPPFEDDVAIAEEGNVCNYYNYENVGRFLTDIIEIAQNFEKSGVGKTIELRVKPKRAFSEGYSSKYYEDIEAHSNAGDLVLLAPDANLGSAISESHLVIAIPFTSPVYIAESLGIPSIFFDPSGDIVEHSLAENIKNIYFISSKNELQKKIFEILNEC